MPNAADEPDRRQTLSNLSGRLRTLQIDRRGLCDRLGSAGFNEELLVFREGLDREAMDIGIAVEQSAVLIQAVREVVRFLYRTHEDGGMFGQVPVQCGGPCLCCSNNDEIWQHATVAPAQDDSANTRTLVGET